MTPEDNTFEEDIIIEEDVIEDAIEDTQDMRVLEAALFATREPMNTNALQSFVPHLNPDELHALIGRIRQDYSGRGIVLEETGGGFAFRTAPDLAESLSELRVEERKLSRAGMETLSVIAYHQPVTRAEIEAIRGVATSKGTVDLLLETGWIKPGRRRETPGRPLTWVTTPAFLDHFGLESIVDLPGLDDLKAAGLLDRRPAVAVMTDLFDDDPDGEAAAAAESDAETVVDAAEDADADQDSDETAVA